MKRILVLGATGSIGTSTIDIIENESKNFQLCGITAHSNLEKAEKLAGKFNCPLLITKNAGEKEFSAFIDSTNPDIIVNGIAGAAGLLPSKLALEKGIDLALANKETIVMAGNLIQALAHKTGAKIIPVDSEHSAIFNLVEKIGKESINHVVITASGGPFRNYSKEELENVTVEQALNHPTWKMGKKITIDSSTLANKGLEVIEAAFLFDKSYDQIEVVVHPQSLVHSLVRTNDGMLYAQISDPDMKHPIIGALNWPENKSCYLKPFDLFDHPMEFYKPRTDVFPLLECAFDCVKFKGSYPIAFNAANEIAVAAFLDKEIKYTDISKLVKKTLENDWTKTCSSFDEVFDQDKKARNLAMEIKKEFSGVN